MKPKVWNSRGDFESEPNLPRRSFRDVWNVPTLEPSFARPEILSCKPWPFELVTVNSSTLAKDISSPPVVVRAVDDVHVVGIWGTTLIQIWRGAPTNALTTEANRIAHEFVASSPIPASNLFIVEAKSPPPDDETRKTLAAFSRDIVSRMSISVVVAEGGGFRSALVRGVGVALTMILPHSSKFKFVNDLSGAVSLIEPHLKPGIGGARALINAANELRGKIGARG